MVQLIPTYLSIHSIQDTDVSLRLYNCKQTRAKTRSHIYGTDLGSRLIASSTTFL